MVCWIFCTFHYKKKLYGATIERCNLQSSTYICTPLTYAPIWSQWKGPQSYFNGQQILNSKSLTAEQQMSTRAHQIRNPFNQNTTNTSSSTVALKNWKEISSKDILWCLLKKEKQLTQKSGQSFQQIKGQCLLMLSKQLLYDRCQGMRRENGTRQPYFKLQMSEA